MPAIPTTEREARDFVECRGDKVAIAHLDRWVDLLRAENDRQNLVSKASLEMVWQRHIADSAQITDYVSRETQAPWVDFGAGAGFPGIVLAILRPEQPVFLIEARRRRIDWLRDTVDLLGLENCHILPGDAQKVTALEAGLITARAFASLAHTIAIAARFSTSRTTWVLPKGQSAAQEVSMLPDKLANMFHVEPSKTCRGAGLVVGTGRIAEKF